MNVGRTFLVGALSFGGLIAFADIVGRAVLWTGVSVTEDAVPFVVGCGALAILFMVSLLTFGIGAAVCAFFDGEPS